MTLILLLDYSILLCCVRRWMFSVLSIVLGLEPHSMQMLHVQCNGERLGLRLCRP